MLIRTLIFTILFGFCSLAMAADPIYTTVFNNRAVGGYDAVSYFSESGPVKGSKKYQTQYKGADWRFSSQENLDAFLLEPEKYAPAYGGYCAYAVSQGTTFRGDPRHWNIHEGKLYLNFNNSVNKKWKADKENFITLADEKWPKVLE